MTFRVKSLAAMIWLVLMPNIKA